jgi:L,D-peptidoglycan transpeptidase YkuD (ErfK/YbiS/YcfS/YnhG family)
MSRDRGPSVLVMGLTLIGVVAVAAVGLLLAVNVFGAVSGPSQDVAARKAPILTSAVATASDQQTEAPLALPRPVAIDMRPPPVQSVKPTVTAAPKATAAKTAARKVSALPDRLAFRGDSKQLIIVTSPSAADSRDGRLQVFNLGSDGNWKAVLSAPTRNGRSGLVEGRSRHQGSGTTPTGIWVLGSFGFGDASRAPSGSKVPWRQITSSTYWTSEQGSRYNTWVESGSSVPGEHLQDAGRSYEFAIDSGYNARPNESVYGRGAAIFIHVMHPGYTAGCISIPRDSMIQLLKLVDPARHPRCVVGTTDTGTATSIWKY